MKNFFSFPILILAFSAMMMPSHGTGLKVGDKATDFKLKNVDGKSYGLADLTTAKGYIVVFTCNHCPYALAYQDRIIALHQKYDPQGYPVVAINPNDQTVSPGDSYEKMVERSTEKSFPFMYLYDETQEVAKSFGATRTPHVYLLDKDLTVKYIGAIDDNSENASAVQEPYLENAIQALQNNRVIAVPETKAIGCTIKWKKS
jgi:peroxiredoxin